MVVADFAPPPATAAWRLLEAHEGFEVASLASVPDGILLSGTSVGVEAGTPWSFRYVIEIDPGWRALRAGIETAQGARLTLDSAGPGRWLVNGAHDPALDGCLDIDLEGSALTNTAPVHRLRLAAGDRAEAPAVYVRTNTLDVERLDQTYRRTPHEGDGFVFEYASPRFGYEADLTFAADGLVEDYPGIARRIRLSG